LVAVSASASTFALGCGKRLAPNKLGPVRRGWASLPVSLKIYFALCHLLPGLWNPRKVSAKLARVLSSGVILIRLLPAAVGFLSSLPMGALRILFRRVVGIFSRSGIPSCRLSDPGFLTACCTHRLLDIIHLLPGRKRLIPLRSCGARPVRLPPHPPSPRPVRGPLPLGPVLSRFGIFHLLLISPLSLHDVKYTHEDKNCPARYQGGGNLYIITECEGTPDNYTEREYNPDPVLLPERKSQKSQDKDYFRQSYPAKRHISPLFVA